MYRFECACCPVFLYFLFIPSFFLSFFLSLLYRLPSYHILLVDYSLSLRLLLFHSFPLYLTFLVILIFYFLFSFVLLSFVRFMFPYIFPSLFFIYFPCFSGYAVFDSFFSLFLVLVFISVLFIHTLLRYPRRLLVYSSSFPHFDQFFVSLLLLLSLVRSFLSRLSTVSFFLEFCASSE